MIEGGKEERKRRKERYLEIMERRKEEREREKT